MLTARSKDLFTQAQEFIPGGVNSPVRAFKSVGADPLFIKKAFGCTITDADNNSYIDYVGSWGPMILGHCHPQVVEAVSGPSKVAAALAPPRSWKSPLPEWSSTRCPQSRWFVWSAPEQRRP